MFSKKNIKRMISNNNKLIIIGIFVLVFFTLILSLFDHTHFNGIKKEDDRHLHKKIFNRFYYTISTLSSAGFGDITPKSYPTKIISTILQFILIVSVMSGVIILCK